MMRCDAVAMVCRPEEQKRLMVMPDAVMGRPALSAIWRAMFMPVAPSGLAQPMITSSTAAGSMPARCTACCTAWPPSVAPWVMLKEPFQLLARGVRAVETITADVMDIPCMAGFGWVSKKVRAPDVSAELLAFGRQLRQQRGRLPEIGVVVGVLGEAVHGLDHVEQPDLTRVVHGAAAPDGEAIAGQVDHVDIARLAGDAVFQDVGAFVDQGEDQALDDFLIGDLARGDAQLLAVGLDHLVDQLGRDGIALARLVVVPARAGLLAEAAQLAQLVGRAAVLHVGALDGAALADGPADVVAGQIAHAERAHGEAELLDGLVHLGGRGAF